MSAETEALDNALGTIRELREYIASQEASSTVLCHLCGKPVWPTFTMYQWPRTAEDQRIVFGHKRCWEAQQGADNHD